MNKKGRRVVIVHSSDEMYGADRIVIHVAIALRRVTSDVEIWLPSDIGHGEYPLCERLTELGIPWRHLDLPILRRSEIRVANAPRVLRSMRRTLRQLRRSRPDLVYLASSACLVVAPLARVARVRHRVLHIQERWDGRSASVLRLLARSASVRIAISKYVADAAQLRRPHPEVVLNAVDDPGVPLELRPAGSGGQLDYAVASRWNRWKGHATLIKAWDIAGCPGTLMVLGGPPASGDGVDVHGLVSRTTDPGSVRVIGEVADISRLLGDVDVLVLPSDEPEPFGLVLAEAFALGRPVIASAAGGPVEIVTNGVDGWLFPPGDASALAECFRSLTPSAVEAAGHEARRTYERRFRPERYHAEIAAIVDRALNED